MSAGTTSTGGVVSTTLTRKAFTVGLPAASVAVTVTVDVPSANVVPGSCEYVIVGVDTVSDASAANVTTAPAALVASAVRSAGTTSAGGVVSRTVTVKLPWLAFPAASVAVTWMSAEPSAKSESFGCEYSNVTGGESSAAAAPA